MPVVHCAEHHPSPFRGMASFAVFLLLHLLFLPMAMGAQSGLTASYFANESLIGPAHITRVDAAVDFTWSAGPDGSIAGDHFSARWTGSLRPTVTESLTLILRTDDGVRLWLDGQLVINEWVARSPTDSTYTFPAVAGRRYTIQIEYFERAGGAVAQLSWQSPTITRRIVPTTALEPSSGLAAFYYPNEALSGHPGLVRNDAQVNFDWQSGGPGSPIGADSFSARWLGSLIAPSAEPLTLIARTDDGVRLWLDNTLVIDSWIARSATDSTYTFTPVAGRSYAVRMEYFERTGGAVAQLLWQSAAAARQVIPATALVPAKALDITLPASSHVNPAFVEGRRLPGGTVTATAASAALSVTNLGDLGFYANAPLNASSATVVSVTSGTESMARPISWAVTSVSGEGARVLRLNDSLLLTSPVAGTLQIVHQCGVEVPGAAIPANGKYPYKFTKPGTYQLYVRDAGGVERGHLEVTCVEVDLDGPIANQTNYRREKGIGLKGGLPSDVSFVAADASLLEVSVKEQTAYGVRLYVKALRPGNPTLVARLGGPAGPVMGSIVIDEYAIVSGLTTSLPINSQGKGVSYITMRPLVRNMTAMFDLFAHGTTFPGGVKKLNVSTNTFTPEVDATTGEAIGTLYLDFEVPSGETDYCFRSNFDQVSKYGTNTGTVTYNGSVITITLTPDPLRLPYGQDGHQFQATATATKPTKFGKFTIQTGRKGVLKGRAAFTSGGGFWEGTTNDTRDIVLNTYRHNGSEQTESGQSATLTIYNGIKAIAEVDFYICAHPVNYRLLSSTPVGADLRMIYAWDSDSLNTQDLDQVRCNEFVTYGMQPPNPPFTGGPLQNPTVRFAPGTAGTIGDLHTSVGAIKGTVGSFTGQQRIEYNCGRELSDGNVFYGPVPIVRRVDLLPPAPGRWVYSITADGVPHSVTLP